MDANAADTRPRRRRSEKECARLGNAIYEKDIMPKLADIHVGWHLAIDLDSGHWEVDDVPAPAMERMRKRRPNAADVWTAKIGDAEAYAVVNGVRVVAMPTGDWSVAKALYERFEKLPKGPRIPAADVVRLGEEIYERDVEPLLMDDHDGEYVSIDVESGAWEISDDPLEARFLLHDKRPDALNTYCVMVGYVAVASIGGGNPRRRNRR